MQININKDLLLKSLSKVHSIIEKRSTSPIFEHVKVDINEALVSLSATDSEIMIIDSFPVRSDFTVSFTTVASILFEIVRRVYDVDFITIVLENEGELIVKAGKSRFRLPCLPADEFPSFDGNVGGKELFIEAASLKFLLNRTKHAICNGETRYYLNGAYVHTVSSDGEEGSNVMKDDVEEKSKNRGSSNDGVGEREVGGGGGSIIENIKGRIGNSNNGRTVLKVVTTDTHRLASAEITLEKGSNIDLDIIIPRKAVGEIIKLLDTVGPDVRIRMVASSNRIKFDVNNTRLISKVIDAKFPDYNDAVQIVGDKILSTSVLNLKRSIDLVNAVSDGRNREIKFVIEPDLLTISLNNVNVNKSSANQQMQASFSGKTPIVVLLNSKYVMESLSTVESELVDFILKDEASPVVIQGHDSRRCLHILMPMRLRDTHS